MNDSQKFTLACIEVVYEALGEKLADIEVKRAWCALKAAAMLGSIECDKSDQ